MTQILHNIVIEETSSIKLIREHTESFNSKNIGIRLFISSISEQFRCVTDDIYLLGTFVNRDPPSDSTLAAKKIAKNKL